MNADVIVIGAGHNGLVAACYLARAGLKTLVVERRAVAGGCAADEEFHPGFRASLAHAAPPLLAQVERDLRLAQYGLEHAEVSGARVFAPQPDGRALALFDDPTATAESLARFSQADARAWPQFVSMMGSLSGALRPLLSAAPPSIDDPSLADGWSLLKAARLFRGLGRAGAFRLLRYLPMAVADLAGEWFETDAMRAVIAARGVFGASAGPWSAGTGAVMLLQATSAGTPLGPTVRYRGGVGALARALTDAARASGVELRTGAAVDRIVVASDGAAGVVLASGEELTARAVVSNADPKRTLLGLVDPVELDPDVAWRLRNIRTPGSAARIDLALDALPSFTALGNGAAAGLDAARALAGRVHIGPGIDDLERAFDASKYGEISATPWLDITIPSLIDPSRAPSGKHVLSIHAQFAPYTLRRGDWTTRRDELGDTVMKTLAAYAPGVERLVLHRRILTPLDLEQEYGLTGGHIHHGELALDQLFTMRPTLGWANYRTPIRNLFLCGAGTHPGLGLDGACGFNAAREIVGALR